MTTTLTAPAHIPSESTFMTLGEVADRYRELKPGRGFLRITFKFHRFEPTGVLRSIKRTGPSSGEFVIVLGGLHQKTYHFDPSAPLADSSECWVWTPEMEKAAAA